MLRALTPADCPFCPPLERPAWIESGSAFAIFDRFPASPGHALVLPRRHVVWL